MADQRFLAFDSDVSRRGSAGDDKGFCFQPISIHFYAMRRARFKFLHDTILEAGSKLFRLLMHALD
jgi:hypothetical protein